MDHIRDH